MPGSRSSSRSGAAAAFVTLPMAQPGQILITQRVHAGAEDLIVVDQVGELSLRGFSRPMRAYNIVGLDEARVP